eukprot:Gb_39116 [translate_table: standard]
MVSFPPIPLYLPSVFWRSRSWHPICCSFLARSSILSIISSVDQLWVSLLCLATSIPIHPSAAFNNFSQLVSSAAFLLLLQSFLLSPSVNVSSTQGSESGINPIVFFTTLLESVFWHFFHSVLLNSSNLCLSPSMVSITAHKNQVTPLTASKPKVSLEARTYVLEFLLGDLERFIIRDKRKQEVT